MQTYAEMVTSLDANIGRVLARLAELGMEQDTVVVFTSDNGGERFSNNWPFSGHQDRAARRRHPGAADRQMAGPGRAGIDQRHAR